MIPALLAILLTAAQTPLGVRVPALEISRSARRTAEYPSYNPFWLDSISNDGRFFMGWGHVISVFDISKRRTIFYELAWADQLDGRKLVMTESQMGHFKHAFDQFVDQKLAAEGGPGGRILAAWGQTYLTALLSRHETPGVIAAIRPALRTLDSNTWISTIPGGSSSKVMSLQVGNRCWIGVWDVEEGKQEMVVLSQLLRVGERSFRTVGSSRFDVSLLRRPSFGLEDIEPRAGVGLWKRPPYTYNGVRGRDIAIRNLRSGATSYLPFPPSADPLGPEVRMASGRILCSYPDRKTKGLGTLYISADRKTWRTVGPYLLLGMSFDRTKVLLRTADGEVWLCPVDKL